MRFAGQFILGFAAVSLISAAAWADDLAMSGNPYTSIVERNIFALVPIPTNSPESNLPPADPPPKITPNGIMSIFGRAEVLFKVTLKSLPGQAPKEDSHVMGEGDREDNISVIKIDDKAGVITFDNNGVVQALALTEESTDSATAPPPIPSPDASMGSSGATSPFERAALRRAAFNQHMVAAKPDNGDNPGGANSNSGNPSNSGGPISQIYHADQEAAGSEPMTPEQNALLIETQRRVYQQQGNPIGNLLPPTLGPAGDQARQILDSADGSAPAP